MNRSVVFWSLALYTTIGSLVYQRLTGPTYPVSGIANIDEHEISYRLNRSHPESTNAPVELRTNDPSISGTLFWKRFKTDDPWTEVPMTLVEGVLKGELPNQPPAGKLMYRVELQKAEKITSIPADNPVVIRFRGHVPVIVVILHVFAMFLAMFLSIRTGLAYFSGEPRLKKWTSWILKILFIGPLFWMSPYFNREPNLKKLTYWTLGVLFVGGFILGPLMQWYSFNAFWTGWPFGGDLTDNKTAVAFLAWLVAAIALKKAKNPGRWALGASIIMFVVYLIPHSVLGSELDYGKIDKQTKQVEPTR
jgi:hypothetical protein